MFRSSLELVDYKGEPLQVTTESHDGEDGRGLEALDGEEQVHARSLGGNEQVPDVPLEALYLISMMSINLLFNIEV